jgi:HAE1 family hydrophobic/amphiphilic exporter-1
MKQPGANVIQTVDRIKGSAAPIAGRHSIGQVDILSDRTTTIRASVNDVQFTLMLTIALVASP